MFDKELLKLIGGNKKYVVYTVLLMVLGMLANIGITASVCWAVYFLIEGYKPLAYIYPAITAVVAIVLRYVASRCTGSLKDMLGRKVKKDLRERTYDKILRLGVRSTDGMSMAGLTQGSMEGIEQLDLYYSTYLPQFFFSMIAPILLFCICVGIDWRTSLVLLACVPLIPVSIVAVSKYAKKIFAKYWGKYTSMGDAFLDSVQGLKELKIFKADAARHKKMNASAEEFRKITMKVLVMQLASTTIMDLVAYGGAGAGIAYLLTGDYKTVAHTIVNALAIVSGIVCDGAKPSCAAKIASAVDAGILGFEMYRKGHQFSGGDGILSKGIENTIRNVGELGRDGMRETDRKILQIMTRN